jgi:hypothetical protein
MLAQMRVPMRVQMPTRVQSPAGALQSPATALQPPASASRVQSPTSATQSPASASQSAREPPPQLAPLALPSEHHPLDYYYYNTNGSSIACQGLVNQQIDMLHNPDPAVYKCVNRLTKVKFGYIKQYVRIDNGIDNRPINCMSDTLMVSGVLRGDFIYKTLKPHTANVSHKRRADGPADGDAESESKSSAITP